MAKAKEMKVDRSTHDPDIDGGEENLNQYIKEQKQRIEILKKVLLNIKSNQMKRS